MGDNVFNPVCVIGDCEIESPIAVHAGLPKIGGFVVFLSMQRWMMEIPHQKPQLLMKSAPNVQGSIFHSFDGAI
jgi:hypothetical protein